MSSITLFVNSVLASLKILPFNGRYVCVAPQDVGVNKIQKVFAIFRDDETPITMEVDASNSSNLIGSIVLDSTLTLEYMITGIVQEGTSDKHRMLWGKNQKKSIFWIVALQRKTQNQKIMQGL